MASSGGRNKTAFPHGARRHVMQLALGCKPDEAPPNIRDIAMKQFARAETLIAGPGNETHEYHAGFLHEWNNLREIYGDNFDKLKKVKAQYDPENRFNRGVDLVNERVTSNMTV